MKEKSERKNVTLSVDEGLWRHAKSMASLEGKTLSSFIQELIEERMERSQPKQPKPRRKRA
jgi:macrodomain Ter protein organizer (MatP/YcbG family)